MQPTTTTSHRALRVAAIVAGSLVLGCALTLTFTVWVGGATSTAEELSQRFVRFETAIWPLVARVAGRFSHGTSSAEREVWLTVIQLNAMGRRNRPIPTGVDPVAIWPTYWRESAGEIRDRIVNGWARGNPGTAAASAASDHFVLQNEYAALVNCQDLPSHVTCIPRSAFERDAREFDGWSAFSQENKGIREYLRVSRVGFNARHSLAVLYAEASCGVLCGGGGYYVFARRRERWHLIAYHEKWVS
jgi:hypothetical protein